MNDFETFKLGLVKLSKSVGACTQGFKDLNNATSYYDLCLVAKQSFMWCIRHGLLTDEIIRSHEVDCKKAGVYCNATVTDNYCLITSDTEVNTYGNSFVVVAGNGKARVNGTCIVYAFDNATVEACDDCVVFALDNSTIIARNYSKVRATGNATVEALDFSSVMCTETVNLTKSDTALVSQSNIHEFNV